MTLVCIIIYVVLQTRISRPRTPPTSLRSLQYRLTLEYTMILFASSKWLARHFHEPKIYTQLAYAYAKTHHLHGMEDELYQVAKSLFTSISNWVRLATTLIYIGENKRLWKVPGRTELPNTFIFQGVDLELILSEG
jgi:hypothetical protein